MTKLYEELKPLVEKLQYSAGGDRRMLRLMIRDKLEDNLPAILSALKNQWIPVSERLPKEGEIVAVSDEDGQLGYGYVERGVLIRASEDLGDIMEWYPLPARPQSQEDRHG